MKPEHASASLSREISDAYDFRAAAGWEAGPAKVYATLATALVRTAAVHELDGRTLVDLGAGTGVASDALLAAGAQPIGTDISEEMLRHRRHRRPPAVVSDGAALPLTDDSVDGVVAAFVLNHIPDPVAGLAECRRVTRPGGIVLAASFPTDGSHPAKAAVHATLDAHGYQRPGWYETFGRHLAPSVGTAETLARAATLAGLVDVTVQEVTVEVGLDDPELALDWRLNMAHTVGFLTTLAPAHRAALRAHARQNLPKNLPSTIRMLVLRSIAA